MPTAKKRINITVDDDLFDALERLSAKRDQSVAGLSLSLIEEALEYQEDLHFSRVADERVAKKERRIPHDRAWDWSIGSNTSRAWCGATFRVSP